MKQFKKDNTGITVLKKDGRSATSPQQKAEMLNAQFSSVFTEEDTENLPQLNKQYPSLSILSVSAIGVEKLLLNLNASKAAGPDKLSGKLLKATAHEIAPVLQVIFQRSIDEGTLPQAWKEATISPVYKKECRSNPANYRPVSLTCILCKILEHIINRHILDHLDEHRILVDAQHGFRKRRSCETQLILTCHDLAKVVNDSGQVDMLVLDFAKAFDTVAHKRLLLLLLSTHSSLIIWGSLLLLSDGGSPPASPASHLAGLLRQRDPSTNPGPIAWWVSVGN